MISLWVAFCLESLFVIDSVINEIDDVGDIVSGSSLIVVVSIFSDVCETSSAAAVVVTTAVSSALIKKINTN